MVAVRKFNPGDLVIKEGDTGKGFFILRSGTMSVRRGEVEVAKISTPATIFGEMSDILEKPRTCNVVAATACEVLFIEQGVDEIVEKEPQLTKWLLKDLAERLEKTTEKLATYEKNMVWSIDKDLPEGETKQRIRDSGA